MILKPFSYLVDFIKLASQGDRWEITSPYTNTKVPMSEIRQLGSRFSGKTWDDAEFVCRLLNTIDKNQEIVKASAFILRREKQDMEDLWEQYSINLSNIIKEQNIKQVKSTMKWVMENGNEVRFKYVNYRNKSKTIGAGWSCVRGNYIVCIYEEAYEFTNIEVARIREAIRGANPNANILEIFICNPWDPRNYFIKNTIDNFKYDMKQIEQFGEQKAIVWVLDPVLGYRKPVIIHYANWRAIQPYKLSKTSTGYNVYTAIPPILIPQTKLDQLTQNYSMDYATALTADYGCPGASGTEQIYFRLMERIGQPKYYEHEFVIGGGDIGNGRSKKSGKTAFLFGAIDTLGYFDIYGEYVWDNKITPKDPNTIAGEVINFYLEQIDKYAKLTNHYFTYEDPLQVVVDLSENSFISILNTECANRGIDFLEFIPCQKLPINDRIIVTTYLMGQGRLRIDPNCSNLLDEFSGAEWDDKLGNEPKRKNDKDHSINAFEYLIEPVMFHCFSEKDKELIAMRISKRGQKYL